MKLAFFTVLLASTAWALPKSASVPAIGRNLAFDSPMINHPYLAVKKTTKPKIASFAAIPLVAPAKFLHGVASGDPLSNAVILWTKVNSTDPEVDVTYQLSTNQQFTDSVARGTVSTTADVDFTVKVDVTGLQPATTYYYRFTAGPLANPTVSPIGRTHTIPTATTALANYRLAVFSCSNLPAGYFNSYGSVAKRDDIDLVLHLGDYIYEYPNGAYGDGTAMGRIPAPNVQLNTLSDYRTRHAQYKQDVDLMAAHAKFPFVTVWDDHEFEDDAWTGGSEGDDKNKLPGQPWAPRKLAAMTAYFQYMPIRAALIDGVGKIYRNFQIGDLLDLTMLDTRMAGRDDTDVWNPWTIASETRTIMGFPQEAWFNQQLSTSQARGAKWRIVGQQVTFSPVRLLDDTVIILHDSWDDYPANRRRILQYIQSANITNTVILTGDIHASLVFNVLEDPYDSSLYNKATGAGSQLVEFVGPSVTSSGPGAVAMAGFRLTQPHLQWGNGVNHGYMIVTVAVDKVTTEYHHFDTVTSPLAKAVESIAGTFETASGSARITSSVTS
ncbi:hypothetical protein HKX48_006192 [Thoreauomyces humboldtii]|nr:hypothetical protein HKX48_006192 [Thoreauomyces humboldtii]